jgi:hypothetical protein
VANLQARNIRITKDHALFQNLALNAAIVIAHALQQKVIADLREIHHTDKSVDQSACTLLT